MTRTWPPQPRYANGNHMHDFAMHLGDDYPEAFGYLLQRDDENEDMWVKSAAVVLERDADGKPSRCATVLGEDSCEAIVANRFKPMKETFSIVDGCERRNGREDDRGDVLMVGLSLPWARKAIANAPGNRISATVHATQGKGRVAFYGPLDGPGEGIEAAAGSLLRTLVHHDIRNADLFEIHVRVVPGRKRTASPEAIATVQAGMRAAFKIAARELVRLATQMPPTGDDEKCAILHMEASVTDERRRFKITPSFAETDPWQNVANWGRRYFVDVAVNKGVLLALAIGSAWELEHGIIDPVEDLEVGYLRSAILRAAAVAEAQVGPEGEMPQIAAMLEAVGCAKEAPAILDVIAGPPETA